MPPGIYRSSGKYCPTSPNHLQHSIEGRWSRRSRGPRHAKQRVKPDRKKKLRTQTCSPMQKVAPKRKWSQCFAYTNMRLSCMEVALLGVDIKCLVHSVPLFSSHRNLSTAGTFSSVLFSSVAQSCPTLSDPMNHSMPGLPVHHQLQEFTQTHIHQVGDAIQPSHLLLSPFPPAPNPSQHQSLFQ